MNHRPDVRGVLVLAVSLMIGGLIFIFLNQVEPSVVKGYPAPYPPPASVQSGDAYPPPGSSPPSSLPPFPTLPEPMSPQAQTAISYIADREGIPCSALTVAAERSVEYPNLGRQFKLITLLDSRQESFMVFKLLVDLNDSSVEEDIYSLRDAEAQAYQARYGGKLAPTLYTRLQTLDDDDELPVAVWAAAGPGQTMTEQQEAVYAVLAARYPEAEAALQRSGTPMDVDDPALAQQIAEEYHTLMVERMVQRTQPLIDELEGRGFAIVAYPGMPSFATVLPKSAIIELGQHDGVTAVYLIDAEGQPELDSAIPSDRVPAVWDRGYDGTGVTIAILERGNVDWDNSFLNHIFERLVGIDGETDHATGVASVAASFDDTYTGVAPGASILSAGTDATEAGNVYALWWVDDILTDTVSLERSFYAERGDMVRVAVSWWSHADSEEHDYSFDRLDTDLDLFLQQPNGAYPDISISHDNNYEMVEIMARQSGLSTIRVDKVGFNEPSNSVGIALARFPAPYHVHLPVVMKD